MNNRESQSFSITKRIKSFGYAAKGIKLLVKTQHNARIHLLSSVLVCTLGYYYSINTTEWCLIIFAMGFVFAMEAINTALEYLVDFISPNYHELAGKIKDLAAGAVLLASITAFLIGVAIFLPRLI